MEKDRVLNLTHLAQVSMIARMFYSVCCELCENGHLHIPDMLDLDNAFCLSRHELNVEGVKGAMSSECRTHLRSGNKAEFASLELPRVRQ
jgi:hypothetical protein